MPPLIIIIKIIKIIKIALNFQRCLFVKKIFSYVCICVSVHMCIYPQAQIQEFPGAGITDELPDVGAVGPLQEQHSSEGLWLMGAISQEAEARDSQVPSQNKV